MGIEVNVVFNDDMVIVEIVELMIEDHWSYVKSRTLGYLIDVNRKLGGTGRVILK